ncbi:hypothetical protein JCM19275_3501 [Nonlabens ulvanivorans]|uniref:Uncharacterized protein n=1 Tax=Nonlabens ulvanivorans TaxID=906888 RepID=A0A090WCF9_NONUL|nr:hypothetical protein [Nonlabens ulvanivorans]GAL74646.1 hypothetical protein JCM19275_3501 [Nonlabens ulvanivorans]
MKEIKHILGSEFERSLLDAALHNLKDTDNKLRYNNFAYSIRELSRHFLHRLSPEENVLACNWFEPITDNGKPSRAQRIKYAIQGGINNDNLIELGFDVEELEDDIKALKKAIDSLSKYTHINPDVFAIKEEDIKRMSDNVLTQFKVFANRIKDSREDFKHALEGKIEEQMIDAVISNHYENVDSLGPHRSLEYSELTEYHIIDINERAIVVEVFGNIYFTLEYGSKKERREGDGLDINEDFPFQTKIHYKIGSEFPSKDFEIEEFGVDTSEWYGDIDDNELDDLVDSQIDL